MSVGIDSTNALAGIPAGLRTPLLEEFTKIARNFREGRWEPTELGGGKLCEVVYSILKGYVDGRFPGKPTKPRNMVDACKALESATGFPRSVRIQIPRMLIAVYEIRNNRNVGHVGADVDPSHMDASVVLSMSQWIMAELVRLFHSVSTEEAAALVDSLVERTIPLLWSVGGKIRILDATMSAKDKTLSLLYGSNGPQAVRWVQESIEYSGLTHFQNRVLVPAHKAKLIEFDRAAGTVMISPLGARYVEDHIPLTTTC